MKKYRQLIIFGIIHALILILLFNSGIYHNSSLTGDVAEFFNYSSNIVHGSLPYRDFAVEYPPLALVCFTIPRLVTSTFSDYHWAFSVEILIFDLLALFLLSKLSRVLGINQITTLVIYTLLLIGIGPLLIYRFDLIPAVMVLACLYAFSQGKYGLAWAILAMGVMTKIYPIVIAPIFLIYELSQHRYKEALREIGLFVLTAQIIILPGFFINPTGFVNSFLVQMHRGLQLESTYSSFILLFQNLGLTKVYIESAGPLIASMDIISPAASFLSEIAWLVMAAALILIYWLFYRRCSNKMVYLSPKKQPDMVDIIYYSFLAVLIFIISSNVFSPQYLIWFIPLAPLVIWRWKNALWLGLIMVSALTYYEFPLHYNLLEKGNALLVYILLSRNILLIVLTGWLIEWRLLFKKYSKQSLSRFLQ